MSLGAARATNECSRSMSRGFERGPSGWLVKILLFIYDRLLLFLLIFSIKPDSLFGIADSTPVLAALGLKLNFLV